MSRHPGSRESVPGWPATLRVAAPPARAGNQSEGKREGTSILLPLALKLWPSAPSIIANAAAPKMRVAIVSDIHGNRRAFQAVLGDLRQVAPDLIVHGGDLAYGGAHPAEIIDQVRGLGWAGVRGNTDEMLWAPKSLAEFAATTPKIAPLLARIQEMIPPTLASIGEERLRWLEGLPNAYSGEGF